MGFIKYITQCVHGWFAMEGVPMLLCTILQRLHLGADAVGSVSVSKVYLSSFQTFLKHTNLYTCKIMINLCFFSPRLLLFLSRKEAI